MLYNSPAFWRESRSFRHPKKSRLWHRRSEWILLLTLAAFPFGNVVADDAPFGIYSGECTLNNEPTRVELEIVRNENYTAGITMTGGFKDVRELRRRGDRTPPKTERKFQFRASDPSETFGGWFAVELTEEGGQLKGTLTFRPKDSRHQQPVTQQPPPSVALTLSRSSSGENQANKSPGAEAEAPKVVTPGEITGVYDGAFSISKRQFSSQLQLKKESADKLSGVLSFSATASDAETLGSFKLKGSYNPANNNFALSSDGELTTSGGVILAKMNGSFDSASGEIRAQVSPDDGVLELTRNTEKTAELQAKIAGAAKRLTEAPVSLAQAKTDEERRDIIVRWFNRLKEEYPDIDLHHTVLDQIYPKVLNLFVDETFVPVFGKRYDAMTADDNNYLKQLFRRLFVGRERRELLDGFGDFLERPFVLPRGSFSYADVAPQLAFRRAVHQKWRETMDQLSTVSSTSAGFDKVLSLKKQGTEPFQDLWPSEFKQFQEAVDSAKHRVAEGALVERLDAALSNSSGYDGIMKLKETVDSNEELFALASKQAMGTARVLGVSLFSHTITIPRLVATSIRVDALALPRPVATDFVRIAEADHQYPITKVLWEPYKVSICNYNDIYI